MDLNLNLSVPWVVGDVWPGIMVCKIYVSQGHSGVIQCDQCGDKMTIRRARAIITFLARLSAHSQSAWHRWGASLHPDNGPSLVITGILFNSAPGRRSSFGVDMKNEAPLYLNCIFDGLRSVNNNGSCWNNGCVFCLVIPPSPWISATHHYQCPVGGHQVPGPRPGGPQCIITGYSHNQPQLAFLSLSQHFVLLHRIKTCYANTIIDLIINPMSCATISAGVTPTAT